MNPVRPGPVRLSEEDVMEAMRSMQGYVDITPGTFREIYELAYAHAANRMAGAMRAGEIMTSPVHCLRRTVSASDAAEFLAAHGISGAPVLDENGRVCGVISSKDFLRVLGFSPDASSMHVVARYLRDTNPLLVASGLDVGATMSTPPITASEDMLVADISVLFRKKHINRLPICDFAGRVVGIVTRTDLVDALSLRG